jgi:phosphonate transport system substrate-binding protein
VSKPHRNVVALVLAASFLSLMTADALAASWKDGIKTVSIGVIPNESDRTLMARFDVLAGYLGAKLGVKVEIVHATDYAGVIEAIRSDKIAFARFGPASYAQAWRVTGGKVEPLVAELDINGNLGYFSAIAVSSDSSYGSVTDLKGKSLAFADPNSTSGYLAPTYFLREQGMDPAAFFSKTQFAGGHDQSVLAMLNGTVDASAAAWRSDDSNDCTEMSERGLIKPGACRFIWKSPRLPSSLWAAGTEVPDDLRAAFVDAMLTLKTDAPKVWAEFIKGDEFGGYVKASQSDYAPIVKMIEANQRQRRAQ